MSTGVNDNLEPELKVRDVLRRLLQAKESSRELDGQIAQLMGWTAQVVQITDGEEIKTQTALFTPSATKASRYPHYTSNLKTALDLLNLIAPGTEGGFSWEPGRGSAKLGRGRAIESFNAPTAICIAALLLHPNARDT